MKMDTIGIGGMGEDACSEEDEAKDSTSIYLLLSTCRRRCHVIEWNESYSTLLYSTLHLPTYLRWEER